jgi:hypothetical protein
MTPSSGYPRAICGAIAYLEDCRGYIIAEQQTPLHLASMRDQAPYCRSADLHQQTLIHATALPLSQLKTPHFCVILL